jgi:hypothetical protein
LALKRKKLTRRLKIEAAKLAERTGLDGPPGEAFPFVPGPDGPPGFERRDPYLGRVKISNADKVVPPLGERKRP